MSRTTSITLNPQLNSFVDELVASGRYGSISDVVRSALRLLEREEQQSMALRDAVLADKTKAQCIGFLNLQ